MDDFKERAKRYYTRIKLGVQVVVQYTFRGKVVSREENVFLL